MNRRRNLPAIALLLVLLFALSRPAAAGVEPPLELVETAPVETSLDSVDIPEAWEAWVAMFDGAKSTIDLSHFYASNEPGSCLEFVIQALERAADRGVRIRAVFDRGFYDRTYRDPIDRIRARKNVDLRLIDFRALAGGVQHAKYHLVDGREAYFGSQNFDWRSLEHIQELGVRIRIPEVVASLADVFETDWLLAGGAPRDTRVRRATAKFPVTTADGLRVSFGAAPKGWIPDESLFELPEIVARIDSARRRVRVQLLTYEAAGREKEYFPDLENALRRAAARGVAIEMILADWGKREPGLSALRSLEAFPNVSIRLTTIPEWSKGFVPFSRVSHSKYMVVDGERAWIGTSNWGRDYFLQTRGVGLFVDGASFAGRVDRYFEKTWSSPYAEPLDLCRSYSPPRVAE